MKIYFRYLLMRLVVPFSITLFACTVIWIMADLYGNIDDFLVNKVELRLLLYFYALQIPIMLVQVLPAVILFSSLWTLLGLVRRSEWLAFQAGGIAPMWLFTPFFLFAILWVGVMAYDMSGPAAQSQVTRDRLLQQVKGKGANRNVLINLLYVDKASGRDYTLPSLDTSHGTATGMAILQRDAQGHDSFQYFARQAKWDGEGWKLTDIRELIYAPDGSVQSQKTYAEKDLDAAPSPAQLALISSAPDQLTLSQLDRYIQTSPSTAESLAKYRTEWWYRVLHPFSLVILMLFALTQGSGSHRRGAVTGVAWAILVLVLYLIVSNVAMAAGRFDRVPAFVAVVATQVIFGLIGLLLLAINTGWLWKFRQGWTTVALKRD